MALKTLALALVCATFPLVLRAVTIVTDPFPPAHFNSLYIEKDDRGTATIIQLAGDAVTYKMTAGNRVLESVTAHPSGDDWFNFIQGLNHAKVYKWAPRYEYPGQGPSWVIDLVMEDRTFNSEGTNEYPKDGTEDQPAADPKAGPSIAFQLFWQAALVLVGKAPVPAQTK